MTANVQSRPILPHYPSHLPALQELAAERTLAGRTVTANPLGARPIPIPPPRMSTPPAQSSDTNALVQRLKDEVVLLANKFPPGTLKKVAIAKVEYQAILDNAANLTPQQIKRVNEILGIIEQIKKDCTRQDGAKTSSEDTSDESPTGSPKKSEIVATLTTTSPTPQKSTQAAAVESPSSPTAKAQSDFDPEEDLLSSINATIEGDFKNFETSTSLDTRNRCETFYEIAKDYKKAGKTENYEIFLRLAAGSALRKDLKGKYAKEIKLKKKEMEKELAEFDKTHPDSPLKKATLAELEKRGLAILKDAYKRYGPTREHIKRVDKVLSKRSNALCRPDVHKEGLNSWYVFRALLNRHYTTMVPLSEDRSQNPCYIGADSQGRIFSVRVDISSMTNRINELWEKERFRGDNAREEEVYHSHIAAIVKVALTYRDPGDFDPFLLSVLPTVGLSEHKFLPVRRDPMTGELVCVHNETISKYVALSSSARNAALEPVILNTNHIFFRLVGLFLCNPDLFTKEQYRATFPSPIQGISKERYDQLPRLERAGKAVASFIQTALTKTAVHSWAYIYRSDIGQSGGFVHDTYERRVDRYMDLISCGTEVADSSEAALGAVAKVPLLSVDQLERAIVPNLREELSGLKSREVLEAAATEISRGSLGVIVIARLLYLSLKKKSPQTVIWAGDRTIIDYLLELQKQPSSELRKILIERFEEEPMQSLLIRMWQNSR